MAQKKVEELLEKVSGNVSKRTHGAIDAVNKITGPVKGADNNKTAITFKAGKGLTIPEQFGYTAGEIHTYLDQNGLVPTSRLINAIMQKKNSKANVLAAIGWLAREDKLQFSKDGEMVSLR